MLLALASPGFTGMALSYFSMSAHLFVEPGCSSGCCSSARRGACVVAGLVGSLALDPQQPGAAPAVRAAVGRLGRARARRAARPPHARAGYVPLALLLGLGWWLFLRAPVKARCPMSALRLGRRARCTGSAISPGLSGSCSWAGVRRARTRRRSPARRPSWSSSGLDGAGPAADRARRLVAVARRSATLRLLRPVPRLAPCSATCWCGSTRATAGACATCIRRSARCWCSPRSRWCA